MAYQSCHIGKGITLAKTNRPARCDSNRRGHLVPFPVVLAATNLEVEFHVEPSQAEKNNFLDRLRDELGLVIASAQRNIEILVFDPR